MVELLPIAVFVWAFVSLGFAAHARQNQKTRLWGVVIFFTALLGMVFYAISLASD